MCGALVCVCVRLCVSVCVCVVGCLFPSFLFSLIIELFLLFSSFCIRVRDCILYFGCVHICLTVACLVVSLMVECLLGVSVWCGLVRFGVVSLVDLVDCFVSFMH